MKKASEKVAVKEISRSELIRQEARKNPGSRAGEIRKRLLQQGIDVSVSLISQACSQQRGIKLMKKKIRRATKQATSAEPSNNGSFVKPKWNAPVSVSELLSTAELLKKLGGRRRLEKVVETIQTFADLPK